MNRKVESLGTIILCVISNRAKHLISFESSGSRILDGLQLCGLDANSNHNLLKYGQIHKIPK
jgi:hypothetical protein